MATDNPQPEPETPTREHNSELKRLRRLGHVMVLLGVLTAVLGLAQIRAEHQNNQQQEDIQESIDSGRVLIGCLIGYADELTKAQEQRDTVNSTARAAEVAWLNAVIEQIDSPNLSNPQEVAELTKVFRNVLVRLNNPKGEFNLPTYPDIRDCLRENDLPVPENLEAAFKLVAYSVDGPPREFCFGRRITISGSPQSDIITGTTHRDVIWGNDGGDLINGSRGKDRICGGYGGDIINGGQGFDRANGGPGTDVCYSSFKRRKCP